MHEAKPVATPLAFNADLQLHSGSALSDGFDYKRPIGSLQYLALTRPDLSFVVNKTRTGLAIGIHWLAPLGILFFLVRIQYLGERQSRKRLLEALPSSTSLAIFCDNIGATYLTSNPVMHSRMKHIAVDLHLVRDLVDKRVLHVSHVASQDQLVDGITKPLSSLRFSHLRSKIGVADGTSILQGSIKESKSSP
ncbi:hypothetical protein SLEP1_g56077 [Rubroshorea leprosula]|uniref:Retrovirus-related Pol polyprotein from transposon RE1 n=1 Tax=Rubroshorea leprosula TaxID=152421 RepID=A0AAV5MIJ7_9ROSI|nr:hypothetical protein SLEP1_g56077 [Rubroshorea leprosula]